MLSIRAVLKLKRQFAAFDSLVVCKFGAQTVTSWSAIDYRVISELQHVDFLSIGPMGPLCEYLIREAVHNQGLLAISCIRNLHSGRHIRESIWGGFSGWRGQKGKALPTATDLASDRIQPNQQRANRNHGKNLPHCLETLRSCGHHHCRCLVALNQGCCFFAVTPFYHCHHPTGCCCCCHRHHPSMWRCLHPSSCNNMSSSIFLCPLLHGWLLCISPHPGRKINFTWRW